MRPLSKRLQEWVSQDPARGLAVGILNQRNGAAGVIWPFLDLWQERGSRDAALLARYAAGAEVYGMSKAQRQEAVWRLVAASLGITGHSIWDFYRATDDRRALCPCSGCRVLRRIPFYDVGPLWAHFELQVARSSAISAARRARLKFSLAREQTAI
jgi:hypothetical protein